MSALSSAVGDGKSPKEIQSEADVVLASERSDVLEKSVWLEEINNRTAEQTSGSDQSCEDKR